MEPGEEIVIFLSEFGYQVRMLEQIYMTIEKKKEMLDQEGPVPELVESAGYWLHNLYCGFEDLFKLIAGYWENHVKMDGEYHIQLLKRMHFAIEGIRPALLTDKSFRDLNELRGFRHAFRHAYTYGLDHERVGHLLHRIIISKKQIFIDIENFRNTIQVLNKI
jgi:hypothetical protein